MTRQERNQHQNTMTSTARKPPSLVNPRAVLKSRLANDLSSRAAAVSRQSQQPMSAMSPEARAAMMLAREDTKDSTQLRSRPASLPRLNINNNANNRNRAAPVKGGGLRGDKDDSFNSDSRSRDRSVRSGTVSDFNDSGISSVKHQTLSSGKTTTTTAASTATKDGVSNINDMFETDNNNNNNNKDAIYRRQQLRPLSRISRSQTPFGRRRPNDGPEHCDDCGDKSVDDDFSPGRTNANNKANRVAEDAGEDLRLHFGSHMKQNGPKSFVLALDAALEANRISRLRGDITDQNNESILPNTVRALNGGRLSNAQEVVVNVCHGECDQELVFHDDDIESLDTARAASEIRVNTWLEYNQDFPPDDAEEVTEFYGGDDDVESKETNSHTATTKPKTYATGTSTGVKSTLRVPTARVRSAQVAVTKSHGSTSSPCSSSRGAKPPISAIRKDSNNNNRGNNSHIADNPAVKNNSAGSGRSKSGSAKDNSSRFGSAASNDSSSRRSSNPPAIKRETFTRKAKS